MRGFDFFLQREINFGLARRGERRLLFDFFYYGFLGDFCGSLLGGFLDRCSFDNRCGFHFFGRAFAVLAKSKDQGFQLGRGSLFLSCLGCTTLCRRLVIALCRCHRVGLLGATPKYLRQEQTHSRVPVSRRC